jgi:hypothetical protein
VLTKKSPEDFCLFSPFSFSLLRYEKIWYLLGKDKKKYKHWLEIKGVFSLVWDPCLD